MKKKNQPVPITKEPLKALGELIQARELTNCFLDLAEDHLNFDDFKMARYVSEQLLDCLADNVLAKLPERASVLNLDNPVSRDFVREATAMSEIDALLEALPVTQSN